MNTLFPLNRRRALAGMAGLTSLAGGATLPGPAVAQSGRTARTEPVAQGLSHPWAMAELPGGRWLVTERPGRLRLVQPDGRISPPLPGLPAVDAVGQGGLLDVVLSPGFAEDRRVYWSYAERRPDGGNGTSVARARLLEDGGAARLAEVQVIFRQTPSIASRLHFGSRLVFDRQGMLFVGLGDRFSERDRAPLLDNHLGKIVRLTPDGGVPEDNPLRSGAPAGALPQIWSWGHRNIQGAALHPATGELWITEHGPQGGDELNRVRRGGHHGWPVITHGREYGTGFTIGDGTARADVVAPLRVWPGTSIAPSGLAFVTGDRYPGWKGSLLLGALRDQALWRLQFEGDRLLAEERLPVGARVRDVRQAADGQFYLLTDEADGKLLRLLG